MNPDDFICIVLVISATSVLIGLVVIPSYIDSASKVNFCESRGGITFTSGECLKDGILYKIVKTNNNLYNPTYELGVTAVSEVYKR